MNLKDFSEDDLLSNPLIPNLIQPCFDVQAAIPVLKSLAIKDLL